MICTAGVHKKTEYKHVALGYAEVLENTQFVLIATVQKLYSMLRNGETWDLGEPELNYRGQPVVHNVASKLGCLRPNSDLDLPSHSIFDEAELARQLPAETHHTSSSCMMQEAKSSGGYNRASSSAASDAEHSDLDLEPDYRCATSAVRMSPASPSYANFDVSLPSAIPSDCFPPPPGRQSPTAIAPPQQSPSAAAAATFQWVSRPPSIDFASTQQMWMTGQSYMDADLMAVTYLHAPSPAQPNSHVRQEFLRDGKCL